MTIINKKLLPPYLNLYTDEEVSTIHQDRELFDISGSVSITSSGYFYFPVLNLDLEEDE